MPRNTSGVYTLPAGNPVSPATIIESAWANITLADVANEVTNSLDRSGRGSMLAAFKSMDGTQAQPGITFGTEPASGFYRNGASDIRMAVAGADVMRWTPTGVVVPGTFSVTGAVALGATTVTGTSAFNGAVTITSAFPELTLLSGVIGNPSYLSVGRTTGEAIVGVAGGVSQITFGDAAGDMSFRNNSGRFFWSGVGGAQLMQLSTSGQLGIGMAPAGVHRLEVNGSANIAGNLVGAALTILRSGPGQLYINASDAAGFVTINTAGFERARFDSVGNFGVGGNPVYRIHAVGSGGSPVMACTSSDASGVTMYMQANTSVDGRVGTLSNHPLGLYTNSIERARWDTAGIQYSGNRIQITAAGEGLRIIDNSAHITFFNAPGTVRSGYLQMINTGVSVWANEVGGAAATSNISVNGATRLIIDGAGRIQGPFLHNNASGIAGTTQYIGSGTYTPAPSALVNCSVNSVQIHQYLRDGNVVTVSGAILINTVAAGLVQVTYAPPIASTWASPSNCAGALAASITGGVFPGFIQGVSGNVVLNFYTSGAALHTLTYSFTYTVA